MKSLMTCVAVGMTFAVATLYSACSKADELPVESVCSIKAELYYDAQVAFLADLEAGGQSTANLPQPDQTYGDVREGCEWDEAFGAGVPLNELIAADGEPVWPVCKFEGGCVK